MVSNQDDARSPMTLPEKLAALPPDVSGILRDRELLPTTGTGVLPYEDCHGMTTADARLLDAALRHAEFEQDAERNRSLLEYHLVVDRPEPGLWWLKIWFEPILPDGTITCSGCG
jgi:hypothetical protein